MSEYRFTGPFYNDFEERETVTPPPVQEPVEEPKKSKKKRGFGKTILKTICIALLAGIVGGGAFLGVLYYAFYNCNKWDVYSLYILLNAPIYHYYKI